jgi:hypothetical protein
VEFSKLGAMLDVDVGIDVVDDATDNVLETVVEEDNAG